MTAIPPTRLNRSLTIPAEFDIRRTRAHQPPVKRASPRTMDAETIVARLEEAGRTLLSLPQNGRTHEQSHPRRQMLAEALGAFTAAEGGSQPNPPPAARITRMDQALAWIPLIPAEKLVVRRIIGCRCLVSPITGRHLFSWRRLARLLGADHKAIQRWHAAGIDLIVATLKRDADIFQAWDSLR